MGFLKAFWAALLLTIAGPVCWFLLGPGVVTMAVLGAAALGWIVQGFMLVADQERRSRTDETAVSIRDSIFLIVEEVNVFVDEEVSILNESLTQIQRLASDAVSTLSQSMQSLNRQVHMQSKLLHELAGISAEEKRQKAAEAAMSLGQYVDDSESVIRYFLNLLDQLVEARRQLGGELLKIRDKVTEVNRIAEDSGGSTEVRLAMPRLRTMIERLGSRLDNSPEWDTKRSAADRAVSRMEETREKLGEMRDIVAMNVQAFSTQSTKDVGQAIRSLQFEDIVTQLVADAQYRLDEMNQLVRELNSRTSRLKVVEDDTEALVGALEVVQEIRTETQTRIERLRSKRDKPVGQTTMDEGTIELF